MQGLKILVADDHELMRRGVRSLLEAEDAWEIVAEASDGYEALKKAQESKPDIIVLDIGMPGLNGLEAARRLRKILPEVKILILSMHDSGEMARAALEAGARGYVTKADAARDLVLAVEAVCKNKTFFTPRIDSPLLQMSLEQRNAPKRKPTKKPRTK